MRTRRRPWNRTPDQIEEQLVRLHIENRWLGAGGLGRLAHRVLAFNASRETVRKIIMRRRDLIVALEEQRRRRPRRIRVLDSRLLWGPDLTLVWLFGFIPIWLLGVVDYHGSRLLCLRRLPWTTSAALIHALEDTFRQQGMPTRLLTDNAAILTSDDFEAFLASHDVRHSRIRPAHAWTNGRIERLFRTFKETIRRYAWSSHLCARSTVGVPTFASSTIAIARTPATAVSPPTKLQPEPKHQRPLTVA